MKRILILLVLLLLLAGCKSLPKTPDAPAEVTGPAETVDLMPGASPETSALALYTYDGKTVTLKHLFDQKKVEQLLQDFHTAKVQPVEPDTVQMKAPYYGIEIGGQDGFPVCGLWSQGYFLADDGKVYAFDYDFSALEEAVAHETGHTFSDPAVLPCAVHAARTAEGWNTAFLIPAEEPEGEKGVSVELVSASREEVVVRYSNHAETEWTYGLDAQVQALVNGRWYNLPMQKGYGFISIAKLVEAGKSVEQSYGLQAWGDLYPGTYRLVSNGLSAEFVID